MIRRMEGDTQACAQGGLRLSLSYLKKDILTRASHILTLGYVFGYSSLKLYARKRTGITVVDVRDLH